MQYEPPVISVATRFKFKFCDEQSICGIIKKCKNKKDLYGLNREIIYNSIEIIGPVLMKIINVSLLHGIFPNGWKESTVVPVEKVKGTTNSEDFRPINMLPMFEKV